MDAKKTWEITDRMIQGQFTADAVGRSDADYLKATNKADIDASIKESLEFKLDDVNEQLGEIYDIRHSGSGRYTVEYSVRGVGRGKNYQVRRSVVNAPAPMVKDANPMEMLRAVNEAQKALQRAEKGSAEYNAAKKKLDALVAEMAKANRAFEAAGGKYKRSTEGQANRANADSAVKDGKADEINREISKLTKSLHQLRSRRRTESEEREASRIENRIAELRKQIARDSAVKDAIPADILKSAEFKAMVKLSKDLSKQSNFLRKSDDTPDGKLKLPNGEIITKFEYSARMRKILDQVNEMARKLRGMGVDFNDFVKYVDG